MKKIALLLVLSLCVNTVLAENFFQNSNPFPQTSPQEMTNIYAINEPLAQQEESQPQKSSWFRRNKKQNQAVKPAESLTYPVHEGVQGDGSFYVFK